MLGDSVFLRNRSRLALRRDRANPILPRPWLSQAPVSDLLAA